MRDPLDPGQKFPPLYPFVASIFEPHEFSAGQAFGSRPYGVTLHYTADTDVSRVRETLKARKLGYHLVIERDGRVTQLCYLDRRTNHAGPSEWNGHSCNKFFAAVALVSWGELKDGKSWSGVTVPKAERVTRPDNVAGKLAEWHAATSAQEKTLLDVLTWFRALGVNPANFCGHDEAAIPPGRKVDPGGVLPWTMGTLRQNLGVKIK